MRRRPVARAVRFLAGALVLAALAAPSLPAAAATQKKVPLVFTEELLSMIATDSQGEQTAVIVDRLIGLSSALANARLQRASGRISLHLTTAADENVPVEFEFTLDKMAYYRMRTARADAAGMTQVLQEAKSFEPLLLEVSYRHDGRYAVVDCVIDLRPALAAARAARERQEGETRAAAAARAADEARAAAEARVTAALKLAASLKAGARPEGSGAAKSPPPPQQEPTSPAQHEGHLSAKALGRETEPLVDGLFSDAAWLGAERFTFEARGASGKIPVSAWALWSPERIWIMVRWPDRSKSDVHRPWIWSKEARAYVAGSEVEDALSLSFAREGRIGECMLAGREAVSDLWTWRAARTDPTGFAEDATLALSLKPQARTASYPTRSGGLVFVRADPDAGVRSYEARTAGEYAGDRIPSFNTRTPAGSAGDVAAKGFWKDGHWLVEFSRRLSTGDPADAVLLPGQEAYLSIAVFDAREQADHSTSQEIVVRLE